MFETIFTECIDPVNARRLYLVAEPIAPTADGLLVAADAVEAFCSAFQGAASDPLATALSAAFESANNVVWTANQPRTGQVLEGRIHIGMTAVAVTADTMLIVQAPPSQAILVQDGQVYAVPPLESWQLGSLVKQEGEASAESASDADVRKEPPAPLGFASRAILRCHESTANPTDLVVLCASALGWGLCRGLRESGAVAADLVPALTGDADSLRMGLDEIAASFLEGRGPAARLHQMGSGRCWIWTASSQEALEPVGTSGVPVGQGKDALLEITGMSRSDERPTTDNQLEASLAISSNQEPRYLPISRLGVPNHDCSMILGKEDNAEVKADGSFTGDTSLYEGVTMDDPRDPRVRGFLCRPQRDRIRYAMVDASERVLGRRDQSNDRFAVGAREFMAPGARSVRAYRSSIVGPISPELRAHLPRGPVVHVPVRFLSVLVACMVVLGGAGFLYDRHEERTAQAEQMLAKADVELAKLAKADGGAANVALIAAQAAVDDARDRGASDKLVASRQDTIDAARDQMLGIVRLEQVTRVGTVPNLEKGDRTRLIRQGRDIYLVNGGFYQLDPVGRTLTELLAPGMRISNATVSKICDGTVDGGVITVTDGKAIYRLNDDVSWTRKKIGLVDGKSAWDASSCGAFDGSFYLLNESGGQILKFEADRLSALPDNWAGSEAQRDLVEARDMVVDGRIYVLLADGDIQTYYRGALQTTISLDVRPGLSAPKELYGGVDTAFLYVADRNGDQGRIVRFERGGAQARQYVLPPEGQDGAIDGAQRAFADIDDFVVDEVTGVIYILSGDQIWSATIPRTGTTA